MAFEVPCPHEGDKEACSRCWASDGDTVPYCTSNEYKLAWANALDSARAGESAALERCAELEAAVARLRGLLRDVWHAMHVVKIGEHGVPLTECFTANTELRETLRAALERKP